MTDLETLQSVKNTLRDTRDIRGLEANLHEHGTSDQVTALYVAFMEAQAEFPEIKRESLGVKYGSKQHKYADLAYMLNLLRPMLHKHGLAVFWPLSSSGTVTTILVHKDGGRLVSSLRFEPHNDSQELGKQFSYMARYAFQSMMGVAAEDDLDATGQAPRPAPRAQPARRAAAAPRQATAPRQAPTPRQRQTAATWVGPFGHNKGVPLAEIPDAGLQYYLRRFEESLVNPAKEKWKNETQIDIDIVSGEIERRAKDAFSDMDQPFGEDAPQTEGPFDERAAQYQTDLDNLNKAIDEELTKLGFVSPLQASAYCKRTLGGKSRSEATYQELLDLHATIQGDVGEVQS